MAEKKNVDLTEGVIWKQLLRFVWPIIIANVFQRLYDITNSMIVGNYISKDALSAVSACSSISVIANYFFYGVSTACGIMASHYYGAKDKEKLNEVVETSLIIAVICGISFTILAEIFTPALMAFSNVDASIYADAERYLRVYMLGNTFVFLYNITFFILRSIGDSRHPLYYLMISCVINIILGVIFVRYLNMGVIGTAVATIIAQFVVDIFAIRLIFRMKDIFSFDFRKMRINWDFVKRMATLGVPASIQNMLIGFSSMVVQSNVNLFANEVIAGVGVAEKVANWVHVPMMSISTIGTSYVGQNLGAKKYDRVQEGIRFCNIIATIITIILSIGVFWKAEFFISLFNKDLEVIKYGSTMVRYSVWGYIPLTWSHIYNGSCRGAGNVKIPLIIAVMTQCVFRYLFVVIGLRINFDIHVIYLAGVLTYTLAGLFATLYFKTSKWTKEAHLRP